MNHESALWVPAILELFEHLPQEGSILDRWKDFLLWAAYQAGEPRMPEAQSKIITRYGSYSKVLFTQIFRRLCLAVYNNPHQNALLQIAIELHLADTYIYDERPAEHIFQEQLSCLTQRAIDPSGLPSPLSPFDAASLQDADCAVSHGSTLIALSNVIKERCPKTYQEQAILVAAGASDGYSHLMSFIQLSIMGMPTYVLLDGTRVTDYSGLGLFVPENAICSPEFFSDAWTRARWESIIKSCTS